MTQISKHPGGLFLKLQSCDWNSIVAMIEMHQFNRSIALIQSSDFNLQSSDCINSSIKFQWWNTHDWNDLLSSSLKLTSWLKWWTVSKKDCNCINYFRFESWVGMHSPGVYRNSVIPILVRSSRMALSHNCIETQNICDID